MEVTITNIDGKTKSADVYPDDIHALMGTIMSMSSSKRDAPVCLTITRKDIIKKMTKEKDNGN